MKRIAAALAVFALAAPAGAWDYSRHSIPVEEILSGGPPRDGIPALLDPKFVPAGEAGFLKPNDRVLGFVHGDEARAYPIRILSWHELVNDRVGGVPVLASW
jgi:hypothetical protein